MRHPAPSGQMVMNQVRPGGIQPQQHQATGWIAGQTVGQVPQQQQQQPSPQQAPTQPQQVRPLTLQQQQMLQHHIQNMSPQARQQLQQLTPQMRYC